MIGREDTSPFFTPDSGRGEIKFIADAMLGRLARWLRFLGFDTAYISGISDSSLIRMAREQDRVILTRDTRLTKIKGLSRHLLILSNDPFQQLLETISAFRLKEFQILGRCVACNGTLRDIEDKSVVRDQVPEYIFLHNDAFRRCGSCGRLYWEGSHPKRFMEEIGGIWNAFDNNGINRKKKT